MQTHTPEPQTSRISSMMSGWQGFSSGIHQTLPYVLSPHPERHYHPGLPTRLDMNKALSMPDLRCR